MHKVCLIILDGFGYTENRDRSPIHDAKLTTLKKLSHGGCLISAHGEYVGLMSGQMGNSEVGHLTIGAGRVVPQDLLRINHSIKEGTLNEKLNSCNVNNINRLHFVGLVSDGGIHSHIDHLKELVKQCKYRAKEIFLHFISDGRDTNPRCFEKYYEEIKEHCQIASIGGRYFAMDRNNNTDRIEEAFISMTEPQENSFNDILQNNYNLTRDEMLRPCNLLKNGVIKEEDTIFFFNFRADRMKQIVKRFSNRNKFITLTVYEDCWEKNAIFNKIFINNTLTEIISNKKIKQTHIAETEKFAHVTYFFNGRRLKSFNLEHRVFIPSPDTKDYSTTPGMSTKEVGMKVIEEIQNDVPFIVTNLAAPDMIGHTGNYDATCKALEILDMTIKDIYEEAIKRGYKLIITADHGNCEVMIENNVISTKHTTNKVPFIVCDNINGEEKWGFKDSSYSLKDVAPTILKLMGIDIPSEMTGSIIEF